MILVCGDKISRQSEQNGGLGWCLGLQTAKELGKTEREVFARKRENEK